MEEMITYIKPELICVSGVLYFLGKWMKQAECVKDKYIPFFLGAAGICICGIWVVGTTEIHTCRDIAMMIFTIVIQGILTAGVSTYITKFIKQNQKNNENSNR